MGGPMTTGTIKAIDGSTLTVTTSSGATTVTTSSSTVVTRTTAATLATIAKGDQVVVMGTTSGSKIAARQIVERDSATSGTAGSSGGAPPGGAAGAGGAPPGGAGGPGAPPGGGAGAQGRPIDGTVTKVDGSTITVKGSDGTTYTVSTSSSTRVAAEKTATVASLEAGDTVSVMGAKASNGAVNAARIRTGDLIGGPGGGPPSGLAAA